MDQDAGAVPVGSRRLIYLPYLMGERTPHLDPHCRGTFFGLSAIHTKADLIRAVMEGVSYSLADCFDILREMGIPTGDMAACGGGGTSALWRQMLADLFGCPVKTVASREGPALGAAILAGVGAGRLARDSFPAWRKPARGLCGRTSSVSRIRKITGYIGTITASISGFTGT